MLEAIGVKVGSPEHAKYYKGRVIRKTNNLVTNFTEMLAVAAANKYLAEVGNESRIEVEGSSFVSPNSIITTHFASEECDEDETARSCVVMDPNMRPVYNSHRQPEITCPRLSAMVQGQMGNHQAVRDWALWV